jgi:hypothetical protein
MQHFWGCMGAKNDYMEWSTSFKKTNV